jgi:restriction system protein
MNFLDAAFVILKQANAPLHYADITRRALTQDILDTKGQTPEATMGARLYVDTKLSDSRFRRVSRNIFALADTKTTEITEHIRSINNQTRAELQKRLLKMPPDRFEALIGELLLAIGFEEDSLQVTSYGNDGGIDVRGVLNAGNITEVNAAVQVKRWKNNIQAPIVQSLRGSLTVHEQGIIITTSKFSKGAQVEAQATGKVKISLVDGDKLLDLLMEHRIGVRIEQYTLYSLDTDWWGGIAGTVETNGIQATTTMTTLPPISYPLPIQANARGQTFYAELLSPQGNVRFNNTEYPSPSKAGQVATGWRSCNGWAFWHYTHPNTGQLTTIDELRPIFVRQHTEFDVA